MDHSRLGDRVGAVPSEEHLAWEGALGGSAIRVDLGADDLEVEAICDLSASVARAEIESLLEGERLEGVRSHVLLLAGGAALVADEEPVLFVEGLEREVSVAEGAPRALGREPVVEDRELRVIMREVRGAARLFTVLDVSEERGRNLVHFKPFSLWSRAPSHSLEPRSESMSSLWQKAQKGTR